MNIFPRIHVTRRGRVIVSAAAAVLSIAIITSFLVTSMLQDPAGAAEDSFPSFVMQYRESDASGTTTKELTYQSDISWRETIINASDTGSIGNYRELDGKTVKQYWASKDYTETWDSGEGRYIPNEMFFTLAAIKGRMPNTSEDVNAEKRVIFSTEVPCAQLGVGSCSQPDSLVTAEAVYTYSEEGIPTRYVETVDGKVVLERQAISLTVR